MDLTTEDYIYIESIGLLLYYYNLPKEKQPKYTNLCVQALEIARSRDSMTAPLFKELVAQDAIALQIRESEAIQPDNGMYNILDTLFTYVGDLGVDIIVNTDNRRIKLMSIALHKVLLMLK